MRTIHGTHPAENVHGVTPLRRARVMAPPALRAACYERSSRARCERTKETRSPEASVAFHRAPVSPLPVLAVALCQLRLCRPRWDRGRGRVTASMLISAAGGNRLARACESHGRQRAIGGRIARRGVGPASNVALRDALREAWIRIHVDEEGGHEAADVSGRRPADICCTAIQGDTCHSAHAATVRPQSTSPLGMHVSCNVNVSTRPIPLRVLAARGIGEHYTL